MTPKKIAIDEHSIAFEDQRLRRASKSTLPVAREIGRAHV
jgi:hypothetical protein